MGDTGNSCSSRSGRKEKNAFPPNPNAQIPQIIRSPLHSGKGHPELPGLRQLEMPQECLVRGLHVHLDQGIILCQGSRFHKTFREIKTTLKYPRCSHISWGIWDRQQMGQMFCTEDSPCIKINRSFVSVAGRFPERTCTKASSLKFRPRDCV